MFQCTDAKITILLKHTDWVKRVQAALEGSPIWIDYKNIIDEVRFIFEEEQVTRGIYSIVLV